jgi:hypothetical protein
MNRKELKDLVGEELLGQSEVFYQQLFSTLSANRLMYELGMCPKLIMDMDESDYDMFAVSINEIAGILSCR